MKTLCHVLLLLGLGANVGAGQTFPYEPVLVPVALPGMPGLHSFAWAEWQGQWLLVGGRKDGLHNFRPMTGFPPAGKNDSLFAINPHTRQVAGVPTAAFPEPMRSQFESTNAQFYQHGKYLVITGGYGKSNETGKYISYPVLSVIDVPAMLGAIAQGTPPSPHVWWVVDTLFAVAGGALAMLDGVFYQVGGHRFDGWYHPMPNAPGVGFTQRYIAAALRFGLNPEAANLAPEWLAPLPDPVNLRRRDYNLLPQIGPGGQPHLWAFAGVFQPRQDLPLLKTVCITADSATVLPRFHHFLSNYHCAKAALFNPADSTMHNLFFGGISQFQFDSAGVWAQDMNVPFVRTISRVSRTAGGAPVEYAFHTSMPALLGSGGELVYNHTDASVGGLPIFNLATLAAGAGAADTLWLGHLVGGIESRAANILFENPVGDSWASPTLWRVGLVRTATVPRPVRTTNPIRVFIVPPAPGTRAAVMNITDAPAGYTHWQVHNAQGQLVWEADADRPDAHPFQIELPAETWPPGTYTFTVFAGTFHQSVTVGVHLGAD